MPERKRKYLIVIEDNLPTPEGLKKHESIAEARNWVKEHGVTGEVYRVLTMIEDPITIQERRVRTVVQGKPTEAPPVPEQE